MARMAAPMNPSLAPVASGPTAEAEGGVSAFGSVRDAPAVAYNPEIMPDWQRDGSKPQYPLATHGLPRAIRRARYPELYKLRYGVEMVRGWRAARAVEVSVDHHVRDVLMEHGDQPGKFIVAWHGWLRRLALFELVQNPARGPAYNMVSVFQTEPQPGMLPADLDPFHHRHLTGCIGQIRIPGRADFEAIRRTSRRLEYNAIEQELDADQKLQEKEAQYQRDQDIEEVHEYIARAIVDVANGCDLKLHRNGKFEVIGSKLRSFPDGHLLYLPRRNPERWAQRQVVGEMGAKFTVVTRKGSAHDHEYRAEAHRKIDAELAEKERREAHEDLRRRGRAAIGLAERQPVRRTM